MAYSNLGVAYFNQRRFEDAVTAYEHACRPGAGDFISCGNLGRAYYWAPGKRAQAEPFLRQSIQLATERLRVNPKDGDALILMAITAFYVVKGGMFSVVITEVLQFALLSIASLVYGPMLGAFLLGILTRRANQAGVVTGIGVSLVCMLLVKTYTPLAWTWYVLAGTIVCMTVGYVTSLIVPRRV